MLTMRYEKVKIEFVFGFDAPCRSSRKRRGYIIFQYDDIS